MYVNRSEESILNIRGSFNLNISYSNALKGIALLMLLFHHLFYIETGLYDDVTLHIGREINLVNYIAIACKLCVAIFVFLSGYGLATTYACNKIRAFYVRRFTKLMANYWLIWLVFVPWGFIFGAFSLDSVYGQHAILKLIVDFMGLARCFGYDGINPTWWFMSCIILLYLIFPLIVKTRKHIWLWLAIALGVGCLPFSLYVLNPIKPYLFAFVIGIICASSEKTQYILGSAWMKYIAPVAFMVFFSIRNIIPYGQLLDGVIAVFLAVTYKDLSVILKGLGRSLEFIGKHSMNIFMFHTFIYYIYFPDIIYWSRNPILIYMTLIVVCLCISMMIEWLKRTTGFDGSVDRLIRKIAR